MGRTSYSFYIWSMFFALLSGPPMRTTVMIVLLCCFAVASHYLIERPGLALGVTLLKATRKATSPRHWFVMDAGVRVTVTAPSKSS